MLQKLQNLGEHTNRWIESFIIGRSQAVIVGQARSSGILVSSRVSQCSCFGPILFSIYINGLPSVIRNSIAKIFADDVKLYMKVGLVQDEKLLKEDTESLSKWCRVNYMVLNTSKCAAMHYIRRRLVGNLHPHYLIGSTKIPEVRTICNLGIVYDLLLKFDEHTRIVLGRAHFMLSKIKRVLLKFNVIFFY